jgi:tRNA/rRNA methyltransferase
MDRCRIVLVETHYPGNLGATARVMRNFGVRDLVLVSPIADRADRRARRMSTHGESILDSARIVGELGEALADCALVAGTSARSGGLFRRQTVGTPEQIMPLLAQVMRTERPVALVFGPEPSGLSNEITTRCHHLICITTTAEYPALNLAQAVGICLYELSKTWHGSTAEISSADEIATFEAQEHLYKQLQDALERIHFLYGDKAASLMHAIRHLLGKARLSEMEVKLLLGLTRQIRWYVDQDQGESG